jgi:hypothetical protein
MNEDEDASMAARNMVHGAQAKLKRKDATARVAKYSTIRASR